MIKIIKMTKITKKTKIAVDDSIKKDKFMIYIIDN